MTTKIAGNPAIWNEIINQNTFNKSKTNHNVFKMSNPSAFGGANVTKSPLTDNPNEVANKVDRIRYKNNQGNLFFIMLTSILFDSEYHYHDNQQSGDDDDIKW